MKNVNKIGITAILVILCIAVAAQASDWKLLGLKKVKESLDRDVILVGADEGTFTKIKLTVRKSGIHMRDMKVHFSNGSVFDVQIRRMIPMGGETRVIDLPGGARNIKKVVFWYDSTKIGKRKATVRLWGRS